MDDLLNFCRIFGNQVPIYWLTAEQTLSELARYEISVVLEDPRDLLDARIEVHWQQQIDYLIIRRIYPLDNKRYVLICVPRLAVLSELAQDKYWQASSQTMIQTLCLQAGYQQDEIQFLCRDDEPIARYQYREMNTFEYLQWFTAQKQWFFYFYGQGVIFNEFMRYQPRLELQMKLLISRRDSFSAQWDIELETKQAGLIPGCVIRVDGQDFMVISATHRLEPHDYRCHLHLSTHWLQERQVVSPLYQWGKVDGSCNHAGQYMVNHQRLQHKFYYATSSFDPQWQMSAPNLGQVCVIDSELLILGHCLEHRVEDQHVNLITPKHILTSGEQFNLHMASSSLSSDINFETEVFESVAKVHEINSNQSEELYDELMQQAETLSIQVHNESSFQTQAMRLDGNIESKHSKIGIQSEQASIMAAALKIQADATISANMDIKSQRLIFKGKTIRVGHQEAGFELDDLGQLHIWGDLCLKANAIRINAAIDHATLRTKIIKSLHQAYALFKHKTYQHRVYDLRWSSEFIDACVDMRFSLRGKAHGVEFKIYHCQRQHQKIPYLGYQHDGEKRQLYTQTQASIWEKPKTQTGFFRFSVVLDGEESLFLSPPLWCRARLALKLPKNWQHLPVDIYYSHWRLVGSYYELVHKRCQYQGPAQLPCVDMMFHIPRIEIGDQVPTAYQAYHHQKATCYILNIWQPPIVISAREVPANRLSDQEINYLRQHGNRVTIFIHGYNVAKGEFSSYPKPAGWNHLPEAKASMHRKEDNGSESMHWLIQMEYILNRACDHDWRDYKRIVLFTWPGDRAHQWDFMQAMSQAIDSAKVLAHLVLQCLQERIEVNLISHSLGGGVLIQALNHLAELGYEQCVDTVVMWQAAIPDNALYPLTHDHIDTRKVSFADYTRHLQTLNVYHAQRKKNPWYLPFAHRAAKSWLVLHSQSDNILGPIQSQNTNKPFAERVYPKIVHQFNLHSLYELAVWIGVSPQALLNAKKRRQFYQAWIREHPCDKSGELFPPTFSQAVTKFAGDIKMIDPKLALNTLLKYQANQKQSAAVSLALTQQAQTQHLQRELKTLYRVLRATAYEPRPALGYSGPDLSTRRLLHKTLTTIDQTQYLLHHSAMLDPSPEVYQHIIQSVIVRHFDGCI